MKIQNHSIKSFLGLVALVAFTWLYAADYIISGFEAIQNIKDSKLSDSLLAWVPIAVYTLFATMSCLIIGIFKKIKGYSQVGLIWYYINSGILGGLCFSLFICFLCIYTTGDVITGLSIGIILGLTIGLGLGLFMSLTRGLKDELT